MSDDPRLQHRLQSCLQTILDLEPDLHKLKMADALSEELVVLKEICKRLESIIVREEDVRRIEDATAYFLAELRDPMKKFSRSVRQARDLQ